MKKIYVCIAMALTVLIITPTYASTEETVRTIKELNTEMSSILVEKDSLKAEMAAIDREKEMLEEKKRALNDADDLHDASSAKLDSEISEIESEFDSLTSEGRNFTNSSCSHVSDTISEYFCNQEVDRINKLGSRLNSKKASLNRRISKSNDEGTRIDRERTENKSSYEYLLARLENLKKRDDSLDKKILNLYMRRSSCKELLSNPSKKIQVKEFECTSSK